MPQDAPKTDKTVTLSIDMLNLLVSVSVYAAVAEVKQRQGQLADDVARAAIAVGFDAALKEFAKYLLEEIDRNR